MAEEPIAFLRAASRPAARTVSWGGSAGIAVAQVRFDRRELEQILNVYSRMVAAGEWRDYAIDFLDDCAVFSIFLRASQVPVFRVEKRPKLRNRQGQYSVIAATGQVLKRGHELANVLRVFDRMLLKALAGD
jgi:Protein of unknown function (DUF2794)